MTVGEHRSVSRRGGGSLSGGVMLLIGLLAGIALAAAAGVFLLGIGWATPTEAQSVISASPSLCVSAPFLTHQTRLRPSVFWIRPWINGARRLRNWRSGQKSTCKKGLRCSPFQRRNGSD